MLNLAKLNRHAYFYYYYKVSRVVDLCAAPGSWSQVLSKKLWIPSQNKEDIKIIAVDLQPMSDLEGVTQLQGDITKLETAEAIISHFGDKKAQLVICKT